MSLSWMPGCGLVLGLLAVWHKCLAMCMRCDVYAGELDDSGLHSHVS